MAPRTSATLERGADVDADLPTRLERFLDPFRADFRRRDQARWSRIYLQGLLGPAPRKNVENLARSVALPPGEEGEATQGLHHFLNHSPWDEEALWRRYHSLLAQRAAPRSGAFVLEELAFVKQGRHSVGVQRQLSRALGRKVNCQLAIALHYLGAVGGAPAFFPLALRLYLPRGWLADPERLDAAGVPAANRQPATRADLALQLLDAARAAGLSAAGVVSGPGWEAREELVQEVGRRELPWLPALPAESETAFTAGHARLLDELGLGHFEGRSWRGFHHHACLVMLAQAFLAGL